MYKIFTIITIAIALKSNILFAQTEKLTIGMSLNEIKKIYPNLLECDTDPIFNDLTTKKKCREEKLYNLPGKWYYKFENKKLVHISFFSNEWVFTQKDIDTIFNKYLSITKTINKEYTLQYGSPIKVIKNDTLDSLLILNSKYTLLRYNILKSVWITQNNIKLTVDLLFNKDQRGEFLWLVISKSRKEDKYDQDVNLIKI